MFKRNESGQIALILVLVMSVVSGVVVSLATRSVSQTSTSSTQISSIDANLVAESSLRWEGVDFDPAIGDVIVSDPTTLRTFKGVLVGDSIKMELVTLQDSVVVPICWSPEITNQYGKLVISIFTSSGVSDLYYSTGVESGFTSSSPTTGTVCAGYIGLINLDLPVGTTAVMMSVHAGTADMLIDPNGLALPANLVKNISVGNVSGAYSGIVEVVSDSNKWPSIFNYAVFSGVENLGQIALGEGTPTPTPTTTPSTSPTPSIARVITGGTYSESGGYGVHTFNTSGTFATDTNLVVDILVVGGGGGAGWENTDLARGGGAGGAGGLVYQTAYSLNSGSYSVTVGSGGIASQDPAVKGTNGANSVFGSFTALGGGGGGSRDNRNGSSGGSGGGGGRYDANKGNGGASLQLSQTGFGLGNSGAVGQGGGGGAGGAAVDYRGGAGYGVFGSTYAAGGYFGTLTNGYGCLGNGLANTGNGGNACYDDGSTTYQLGGNGGSGVVIVRYPL